MDSAVASTEEEEEVATFNDATAATVVVETLGSVIKAITATVDQVVEEEEEWVDSSVGN